MISIFPKEIFFIIIKYQMLMGDYNPTIFSKYYKQVYEEYNIKKTRWQE